MEGSCDTGDFPDTKINARGQTIDYSFDLLGRMTSVAYSDGTPSAAMGYDRAGRLRSVTGASGTRTLSWTDWDQIEDEVYTAGLLSGVSIDRSYDAQFRLERLEFKQPGVTQTRQRFAYDGISWLDYIADETPDGSVELHRFDYAFKINTPFIETVAFSRSGQAVMTQSYNRDGLGRLAGAGAALAGGGTVYGVDYQFDVLNRRFEASLADGTWWDYGYNDRSEVTSGKKKLSAGAFEGGKQFEYGFDDIGNRTSTKAGGDPTGANLRESIHTPNALNELVTRTVPGSVWITGEADTNLALQGIAGGHVFAVERQEGERFFAEALVDNHQAAVFARLTVAGKENGTLTDVQTGRQFVSQNPESFVYDADGNLTEDGRWTYTWDAENRLVSITAGAEVPDAAKKKLEFAYDSVGRRIQKVVLAWDGSQYVALSTQQFVYDGWNLVAVLDQESSILQSFTWGLDLSGTRQGAGGVGGLLRASFHGSSTTNCYATFDGNGNVTALVKADDGSTQARYEYGPFGELLRQGGLLARANPFRFSTKYRDEETGLLYYGFRYYKPDTGSWLGRDPIGEWGGINLYCFNYNGPTGIIDPLGLSGLEELLQIGGAFNEGLEIGEDNLRRSLWEVIKSPYTITKGVSSAAGTLSTEYGREQFNQNLVIAELLVREFLEDECFRGLVLEEFGQDARAYFSDPYRLSEFLTGAGVGMGTLGFGSTAKGVQMSEKLGKLFKHLSLRQGGGPRSGVWSLGPGPRGLAIESRLGANLPAGFRVIDRFEDGVATSIKSIDLNAATYQNARALNSRLDGYIDNLAGWTGQTTPYAGVVILPSQVTGRTLQIAVPPGSMSTAQQAVFNAAAQRAQGLGLNFIVTLVP